MVTNSEGLKMIDKYLYKVYWNQEDNIYVAKICEFPSLSAHGETHEKALLELKMLIAHIVEDLKKEKEEIPTPISCKEYSGKINLRMPKNLHKKLSEESKFENTSLNQFIIHKLSLQEK